MSASSPARRVRSGSIRIGLIASAVAFTFIEGYALQDQLTIGQASTMFILGTAFLSAGICIGLFGLITAIGLIASVFVNEQPPEYSPERAGIAGRVDHGSFLRTYPHIKADTYGDHPFPRGARDKFAPLALEDASMPEVVADGFSSRQGVHEDR